jgi:hypothetical protein
MKAKRVTAIIICLLPFVTAIAQNFSVRWFTIAGGGGTSMGGAFNVNGTVGQPAALGAMTNGPFSLTGGLWALPEAVQNTNGPTLLIIAAPPGFARISWAPATPGFVLQSSPSLSPPSWSNVASGPTNPVVVPAPLPVRFYRLLKP